MKIILQETIIGEILQKDDSYLVSFLFCLVRVSNMALSGRNIVHVT